jgi:lipoprotein-anchoring transpeptidase ErfK/SrfK
VSPSPINKDANSSQMLTLPVLDAFFADESFAALVKTRLQLSDEQVIKLKELAHSETGKLNETNAGAGVGENLAARAVAEEKISALIGDEKKKELAALVQERWNVTGDSSADPTSAAASKSVDSAVPNSVPTDSRIVVNAPAYRMDVFEQGRLIKSYKIGIGYPQFPLPTGLRKASAIIFNPTWTPPDEPWVAKMKDVSVGEKVEAGSKLNPLGPIKIPIGGPSLIHGGKSVAKLGTFASHGCVGLTTPQVRSFSKVLAELGGSHLTDAELIGYARDKTKTKQLKLSNPIPVELRYETIVVEDGKLHIYRDVYDQNTNTEEKLREVLAAQGVKLEDLTGEERVQVLEALSQMSGSSSARTVTPAARAKESPAPPLSTSAKDQKKTSMIKPKSPAKNAKEIVIEIAALEGKGYPAPVDLDTGSGKAKAAIASTRQSSKQ